MHLLARIQLRMVAALPLARGDDVITNLPENFPKERLRDFTFGGADASDDGLLATCPCYLKPINAFLRGTKNIVIGERGTGKTALFRLIRDGKLRLHHSHGERHLIVPIDEELQYASLRGYIDKHIQSTVEHDEATRSRIVWEIFILHRILKCLSETFRHDTPTALLRTLSESLGVARKGFSFKELIAGHTKTVGVRLENANTATPTPSFYLSAEPSSDAVTSVEIIDLDAIKGDIAEFLEREDIAITVLIDRLDDFVIKKDYRTQKAMIESLLFCQRGYRFFDRIAVKLFLRSDIFRRLDFESLGYDKIASQTVELKWTGADIRQFIAKRLAYNYFRHLGLKSLEFQISEERLQLGDGALQGDLDPAEPPDRPEGALLLRWTRGLFRDAREGRQINFTDEINRQLITSIFPRELNHRSASGTAARIELFEYLETHFNLGTGNTTPRIILTFIEKCLDNVRDYYEKNPETQVRRDEGGEYPLVTRSCLSLAYNDMQQEVWEAFAQVSRRWRKVVYSLRSKCEGRQAFSYGQLGVAVGIKDEEELQEFVAFVSHIGLFRIRNAGVELRKRKYDLPILFQVLSEQLPGV